MEDKDESEDLADGEVVGKKKTLTLKKHETVDVTIQKKDGKLGLSFGVDPILGCPIILGVRPGGVFGRLHPGVIEQGDTLDAVNGVEVESFKSLDRDGDDRVSRDETVATLLRMRGESALLATKDEVDALFEKCEMAEDGTIAMEEFRANVAETMMQDTLKFVAKQPRPFTLTFGKALEEEEEDAEGAAEASAEATGEDGGDARAANPAASKACTIN